LDDATKTAKALTATAERESSPVFLKDGDAIAYVRGGNLYRLDLADGTTTQLTDIQPEAPPAASTTQNPNQVALAAEQAKLFKEFSSPRTVVRQGGGRGGEGRSLAVSRVPLGWRTEDVSISPSGAFGTLSLAQDPEGVRIAEVPSYVTRSGYTEEIQTYEKVGDRQPRESLRVIDLSNGSLIEIPTPLAGSLGSNQWSPDGKYLAAWFFAEDHKDAWLLGFDTDTKKASILYTEHDDAWVGGPGLNVLGWLPDSSRIYIETEATGYAHLMTLAPDGSDPKALTSGEFEVSNVTMDPERRRFLFVSSEGSLFRRRVAAVSFDGGERERLANLSADDDAAFALSPDGRTLAIVRSAANRPAELFVNNVQVTHTPTAEWLSGPWTVPPIVFVPAKDGTKVPAHFYKPENWRKGGPAVIFVHGAGYLQNVYDGWSYYYREYMFHHLLMSKGYAVLDMDYRGSAGYGKAWRTAIYRHMGGKDLEDDVDGAKWLVKELGVDPRRIGIYGGSYGGFITLMAMFTKPGVFAAGAALRPVTDWAHYNHGYTSEILNLPQDDREAYVQSSPIYHAEGLKGALLICHGMVDTNVHFQDSVRLTQRLIELGKTNWEIAPYPVENHSFTRAASWTDEYRRILALFERTIGTGFGK